MYQSRGFVALTTLVGIAFLLIAIIIGVNVIQSRNIILNPNKFAESIYTKPTPSPTPCGWFIFNNSCSQCQYGYSTDNWGVKFCKGEPYIKVTQNGNSYKFTLQSYPDGAFGETLKILEEDTGKNNFTIKVDPSSDPYLKQMLTDINSNLPQNTRNLPIKDKILTIVTSINNIVNNRKISYYPWQSSISNMKNYVGSDSLLLGDRLQKGYYTCFEAALLTKKALADWGISTSINVAGIHVNLKSGIYTIDPLFKNSVY